jgi:hypothetical protein
MDHDTEEITPASKTGSTASDAAKRSWHAPEIEEVDFAETQTGFSGVGSDLGAYS